MTEAVRRPIGCKNVYIAEKTGLKTYAAPERLVGLEQFQYQNQYNEFTAFSDDMMDTHEDKLKSINLTIQLRELAVALNAKIAGHTTTAGRLTQNVADRQPSFAVLMEETLSDGTSKLHVFYNVTLKREGQSSTTQGENISPSSVTLNGVAKPDEAGNLHHEVDTAEDGIDPTLVSGFFTEVVQPEYTKIPHVAG